MGVSEVDSFVSGCGVIQSILTPYDRIIIKKKHSQLRHLTIYHFSKALQCLVASHAHTLQIWTLWMHPLVFVFDGMREQQRAKCLEKIEWNVS